MSGCDILLRYTTRRPLDRQGSVLSGERDRRRTAEARRRIRELGVGGGYILAPTHDLQSDTPVENVLALFEAARQWGTYPLQ